MLQTSSFQPHTPTGIALILAACCAALLAGSAQAAAPQEDAAAHTVVAQRAALQPLHLLDGIWRGPATVFHGDGQKLELTQTERVGSFVGGSVKVIEGRGYGADGSVVFNAFAVVSYDTRSKAFSMRSYTLGYAGDFPFEVRPDGFSWRIQAGPATIRYTTTIQDNTWVEIGERLVDGQPPVRTFEMRLQRVGDTRWPEGDAVPMR